MMNDFPFFLPRHDVTIVIDVCVSRHRWPYLFPLADVSHQTRQSQQTQQTEQLHQTEYPQRTTYKQDRHLKTQQRY